METAEQNIEIKKPSLFWLLTEVGRASMEFGAFLPYKFLHSHCNTGDGHPVLVLPGFMTTDATTKPLRKFLAKVGYTPFGWDLGRNYAREEFIEDLIDKIESLYLAHQRSVSLIGWSLGGIYARQVAKRRPKLVRQIITLGSPFRALDKPNHAHWMYKMLNNGEGADQVDPELLADIPLPAPVPTTAIYSKQDGIVPWQACLEKEETDIHQNVQVQGSHLGFGVNPLVMQIIVDRLQYSKENWVHYKTDSKIEEQLIYPSA